MKIDEGVKGIGASRPQLIKVRKGPATRSQEHPVGEESVDLTRTAARLNALEGLLDGVEILDMGKVEEVRQAIAEGRFQVDAEAIAERLLQDIVEGLKRQHRP